MYVLVIIIEKKKVYCVTKRWQHTEMNFDNL